MSLPHERALAVLAGVLAGKLGEYRRPDGTFVPAASVEPGPPPGYRVDPGRGTGIEAVLARTPRALTTNLYGGNTARWEWTITLVAWASTPVLVALETLLARFPGARQGAYVPPHADRLEQTTVIIPG